MHKLKAFQLEVMVFYCASLKSTIANSKKGHVCFVKKSQAVIIIYDSTTEFPSPHLEDVKQTQGKIRGDARQRGACLLAPSSLASRPLASCQLHCPVLSLNPGRQRSCQSNMPHNKHSHCQFLLCLYLSIHCLSACEL